MRTNTAVRTPSRNGRGGPDKHEVLRLAAGRWPQILADVAGIPPALLDGKPHGCFKCGGKDRFRFIDQDAGAVLCNQCFEENNGDGLAAVQWARGVKFSEACFLVGEYLGLCGSDGAHDAHSNGSASQEEGDHDAESAADHIARLMADARPTADQVLHDVCLAKRMPVKQAKAFGAKVVLNGVSSTVTFPLYLAGGEQSGTFTIAWRPKNDAEGKGMIAGSWGWFLPHQDDGSPRLPAKGETWLVSEGVKKTSAAASCGYSVAGTPSNAINDKLATMMRGVHVVLVPDNDAPGREGAAKSAKLLAGVAKTIKIANLPDEGGTVKDVRDLLAVERGAEIFGEAIGAAEVVKAAASVKVITSEEFFATEYHHEPIIHGILMRGEAMVFGGPAKSLKTSLAIDAVQSIGSGVEFLGNPAFKSQRLRVALISGESGKRTIQATARRTARAKGINPAMSDVLWSFDLPCLGGSEGLDAFTEMIEEHKVDVVVVDPVYLSLLGEETKGLNPANLFDIGPLLKHIVDSCLRLNCTPILLHHFRKNAPQGERYQPPSLDEFSGSGFSEFARQWILVGRRSRYLGNGQHSLWLSVGGSAGHGGLFALDIDEGQPDDPGGRKWDVTLTEGHEADQQEKERKAAQRAADKAEREAAEKAAKLEADKRHAVRVLVKLPDGATKTVLRERLGISGARISAVVEALLADGTIQEAEVPSGKRRCDGFKIVDAEAAQ